MAEIDLLLKLFDTLKDQMKDMQTMNQALLTNQNEIGNYIRNLPMEETKQLLKDHSKESIDEIGTCTETVETQSGTILNEVKELKYKVRTMIVVVLVAFSLFTSAVLIGRLTTDTDQKHEKLKKDIIQELYEKRSDKPEK